MMCPIGYVMYIIKMLYFYYHNHHKNKTKVKREKLEKEQPVSNAQDYYC